MKDSLVRHWAQRAQMALDVIDRHAAPRSRGSEPLLEAAIEEVRLILCRLAGAATKDVEIDGPPVDAECEDCYEEFGSLSCVRLSHHRQRHERRVIRGLQT